MSFVGVSLFLSSNGEWLAGTTAGPHGTIVGPAGELEGEGPAGDPGEEMALNKFGKVIWADFDNAPLIHDTIRYFASTDELANPFCGTGIVLIVVVQSGILVGVFDASMII